MVVPGPFGERRLESALGDHTNCSHPHAVAGHMSTPPLASVCVCVCVCVCVFVTYILSTFYLLQFISNPDFLRLLVPVYIPGISGPQSLPCYTLISVNPLSHVSGVALSLTFLLSLPRFSPTRAQSVPSLIHPSDLVTAECAPLCHEGRAAEDQAVRPHYC